jgi:hypothetical protein
MPHFSRISVKPQQKNWRSDVFVTIKVTPVGRAATEHIRGPIKAGQDTMMYVLDDAQLVGLWTVVHCFTELHEVSDEAARAVILIQAQILLTAFIASLQPLSGDESNALPLATRPRNRSPFDA